MGTTHKATRDIHEIDEALIEIQQHVAQHVRDIADLKMKINELQKTVDRQAEEILNLSE